MAKQQEQISLDNILINGDFNLSQRGTSITSANSGPYTADRWKLSSSALSFVYTQSSSVPTLAQSGYLSAFSAAVTVNGQGTPGSTDSMFFSQRIEGYNILGLLNNNLFLTLSFWVMGNVTGLYSVALLNGDGSAGVVKTFTLAAQNVWQKVIITFPMNNGSLGNPWNTSNGIGLEVKITLASGSSLQTSTLGSWFAGTQNSATGQVNFMSANNNVIYFSQMMLNVGASPAPFRLAGRNAANELALCRRYYEKSYDLLTAPGSTFATGSAAGLVRQVVARSDTTYQDFVFPFLIAKRAVPTFTFYSPTTGSAGVASIDGTGDRSVSIQYLSTASFNFQAAANPSWTAGSYFVFHWTAEAEL